MANEMVQTIPGAEGRGGIRGDITGSGTGVLLLENQGCTCVNHREMRDALSFSRTRCLRERGHVDVPCAGKALASRTSASVRPPLRSHSGMSAAT